MHPSMALGAPIAIGRRAKAIVAVSVEIGVFQLGLRSELSHLVAQARRFIDGLGDRRLVGEAACAFFKS